MFFLFFTQDTIPQLFEGKMEVNVYTYMYLVKDHRNKKHVTREVIYICLIVYSQGIKLI